VNKLAATVLGGILLAAAPAIAAQSSGAPVREGFLSIGGPRLLEPRATLRIPIRCSVECQSTARTKLKLPDSDIEPSKAKGHLAPGKPRNLIVNLNDYALDVLHEQYQLSRLRVSVRATSDNSGDQVRAVKVFGFTAPE
jgi:hypothetical protein